MKSSTEWSDFIYSETLRLCLGEDAAKPTEADLTPEGQQQIKLFKDTMKEIVIRIQEDMVRPRNPTDNMEAISNLEGKE